MDAKIQIAPYIRDPSVSVAADQSRSGASRNRSTGWLGVFTRLLPHRLFETSESLFVIEIVLLAVLVGTVVAWLAGAIGSSLGIILAMNGLLAGVLLIGCVIEAVKNAKVAGGDAVVRSPITHHWAYRVTNYRQLEHTGLFGGALSPGPAVGISSHIELEEVEPDCLRAGDVVLVEAGQTMPIDGVILDGIAVVDESAVTGQSAPVVRHSGGVKEVMRHTRVVEGHIFVEVTPRRGHPLDWIGGAALTESVRAEPAQR
jgi:high-affinity K+ transport system ATPase subunit B